MKNLQVPFPLKILALALISAALVTPSNSADVRRVLEEIWPVPSTTGSEHLLAEAILSHLPRGLDIVEGDLGGFAVKMGRGEPRLMILVALDDYGFIVGGFTPDGYLTLDRPVSPPHPFFDGFLLGNPVAISTRSGIVQGVVVQPSMHLLNRERRKILVDEFGLDSAFVDIGTRSAAEARERGIEILDAVTFRPDFVELAGGRLSGPSLGVKSLCAVMTHLASRLEGLEPRGETVLVFAPQTKFMTRGRGARPSLGALRAKNRWKPDRVIVLDPPRTDDGPAGEALGGGLLMAHPGTSPPLLFQEVLDAAEKESIQVLTRSGADSPLLRAFTGPDCQAVSLGIPIRFADSPGEMIDSEDLEVLAELLATFIIKGERR